jgi:hypothetical protein
MAWGTLPSQVPLTKRGPGDFSKGPRNVLYVVASLCLLLITATVLRNAANQSGCAQQQVAAAAGPAATAAAGLASLAQQTGPVIVDSTTQVTIKDAGTIVQQQQQQATGALPAAALPPLGGGVPRLIHHMHKNYDALTPSQKMFYERCKVMHPHWWVKTQPAPRYAQDSPCGDKHNTANV